MKKVVRVSPRKRNAARRAKPQKQQTKGKSKAKATKKRPKKRLVLLVGSKLWNNVKVGIRIVLLGARLWRHFHPDHSDSP
jgi:hypothetical protein